MTSIRDALDLYEEALMLGKMFRPRRKGEIQQLRIIKKS